MQSYYGKARGNPKHPSAYNPYDVSGNGGDGRRRRYLSIWDKKRERERQKRQEEQQALTPHERQQERLRRQYAQRSRREYGRSGLAPQARVVHDVTPTGPAAPIPPTPMRPDTPVNTNEDLLARAGLPSASPLIEAVQAFRFSTSSTSSSDSSSGANGAASPAPAAGSESPLHMPFSQYGSMEGALASPFTEREYE